MDNRTIRLGETFAGNAVTVIPDPPIPNVSYRNANITDEIVREGLAYTKIVNSADLNEFLFRLSALVVEMENQGLLSWNLATTYGIGALAFGSDGKLYEGLVADNIGNDPTLSPTQWRTFVADRYIEKPLIAGEDGEVLTSDGVGGVFWGEGGSGGGSTTPFVVREANKDAEGNPNFVFIGNGRLNFNGGITYLTPQGEVRKYDSIATINITTGTVVIDEGVASIVPSVHIGREEPENPVENMIWFNPYINNAFKYNGFTWDDQFTGIVVGTTQASSPVFGDWAQPVMTSNDSSPILYMTTVENVNADRENNWKMFDDNASTYMRCDTPPGDFQTYWTTVSYETEDVISIASINAISIGSIPGETAPGQITGLRLLDENGNIIAAQTGAQNITVYPDQELVTNKFKIAYAGAPRFSDEAPGVVSTTIDARTITFTATTQNYIYGTWLNVLPQLYTTTTETDTAIKNIVGSKQGKITLITASGSWTCPETGEYVVAVGGGGGGGGSGYYPRPTDGGNSSFIGGDVNIVGNGGKQPGNYAAGGVGSGTGSSGGSGSRNYGSSNNQVSVCGGSGGVGLYIQGGGSSGSYGTGGSGYGGVGGVGGGGGGGGISATSWSGGGGGCSEYVVELSKGTVYTVVVGGGGTGGNENGGASGGRGCVAIMPLF